ncbi:MAG: hypothetical protein ACLQDV_05765 [Candidatus Binataceae bacterium]
MAAATRLIHLSEPHVSEQRPSPTRFPDARWSPIAPARPLKQAGLNYLKTIKFAELGWVIVGTILSLTVVFSLQNWTDAPAEGHQPAAPSIVSSESPRHDRYLVQQLQELSAKVDTLSRGIQEHPSDSEQ